MNGAWLLSFFLLLAVAYWVVAQAQTAKQARVDADRIRRQVEADRVRFLAALAAIPDLEDDGSDVGRGGGARNGRRGSTSPPDGRTGAHQTVRPRTVALPPLTPVRGRPSHLIDNRRNLDELT